MLTDFVDRQMRNVFDPPVRSLMDIDFYKFTMGQMIHKLFKDTQVTFKLINRDKGVPLASIVPEGELGKYLDHAQTLRFDRTDLAWLRGTDVYGINMFSEDYIQFLKNFKLPPYTLKRVDDQYELTFRGDWESVSMWETIALAIISELYYRQLMSNLTRYELDVLYARAKARLWEKLEQLSRCSGIRFADFGQRRRHSFLWQEWVIGACKEMLQGQFTGTSNTWMAFHHNLMPIGTSAHELPMVQAALAESDEEKRAAQYRILEHWQELYGKGLRIFLPDTYGTAQFLTGAPKWVAHEWRGMRQDSGDPVRAARSYIEWLKKHGINPLEKLIIFSDGLDVHPMMRLYDEFRGQIGVAFGWGTLLTNDFQGCYPQSPFFKPFSMVCKVVEANGRPVVKLSDNVQKATGPAEEILRYAQVFRTSDRDDINVTV